MQDILEKEIEMVVDPNKLNCDMPTMHCYKHIMAGQQTWN